MRFTAPRNLAFALAGVLVLGACGDSTSPAGTPRAPSAPTSLISDGSRTGGNPDFFFLPPVVANPSSDPDFSPGMFAAGWQPVVTACEVNAANLAAGCIGGAVRTYSGTAVAVSPAEEQYQVQVDTKEGWAVAGKTYRFTVSVVGHAPVALGFVDIALLAGSAKNANTGDLVTMQDGRTIPLKFRIEKGATVDAGIAVYSETVVTDAGATVLTGGTGGPGTFALLFPGDWLPPELSQVVITVERVNVPAGNPCTASVPNLLQTSDCWRVTSYPEIPRVTQDLTVAFCPAIGPNDPRYEAQAMYKFDAPQTLQQLEGVATPLVNCNTTGQIGAREPGVLGAIQYGLASVGHGLAKAFGPNTAWAVDAGWGGRISSSEEESSEGVFSDFFWGIPLRVDVQGGNGQSGATGAALATPVSVRVTGAHVHEDEQDPPIPIPGVTVTFTPAAGSVGATTAITDANGVASTTWTLGSATGAQSLTASVVSVGTATSAVFSATALPSNLLLSCTNANACGGDFIDRGFYMQSFPGNTLEGADLRFAAAVAGSYSIELRARQGGYGTAGTLLAVDTAAVTLPANTTTFTTASFRWPSVNVTQGSVVAFEMSVVAGPAASQLPYYAVPSAGDTSCGITQTDGTTPPLDTSRRAGVWTMIYGTAPIIP